MNEFRFATVIALLSALLVATLLVENRALGALAFLVCWGLYWLGLEVGVRLMRIALLVAVVLVASTAGAETVAVRSFLAFAYPELADPITGTMRFVINSDGDAPFVFEYAVPAFDCCNEVMVIDEANAGSFGINWAALEAILEGPENKSTDFGPVGLTEHTPYLRAFPGEYLDNVDLTRMNVRFDGTTRWVSAAVTIVGDFTILAPEPSSLMLVGLCWGVVHITGRKSRVRRR